MIAGRRLPTAWLFIFEIREVYVVFIQKRKEKCLTYTGYVRSEVATVRAVKMYRGSRCIAPPTCDFGTRRRKAINRTPRPLYPGYRTTSFSERIPGPVRAIWRRKSLRTEPRTLQAVILLARCHLTTESVRMQEGTALMQCWQPHQ